MKTSEIREDSVEELNSKLSDLKKEQFNLRFQQATNQLDNTSRVRQVRRDIARLRTVINSKSA